MKKLTLLLAVGIGYVLGARAGRARYDQIKNLAFKREGGPARAVGRIDGRRHRHGSRRRSSPRRSPAPPRAPRRPRPPTRRSARPHDDELLETARPRQHRPPGEPVPAGRPAVGPQPSRSCQVTALASVSEATWSITTRSRAGVVGRGAPVVGVRPVERVRTARDEHARPARPSSSRWRRHQRDPVVGPHHVVGGDALEHRDLGSVSVGHDEVGAVAHERPVGRRERRVLDRPAEPADQVAGQVLQRGEAAPRPVVRRVGPAVDRRAARPGRRRGRRRRRRGGTTRARSPRRRRGRAACRSIRPATTPSSTSWTE